MFVCSVFESIKVKHQEQSQKAEELQEDVASKAAFNGKLRGEMRVGASELQAAHASWRLN